MKQTPYRSSNSKIMPIKSLMEANRQPKKQFLHSTNPSKQPQFFQKSATKGISLGKETFSSPQTPKHTEQCLSARQHKNYSQITSTPNVEHFMPRKSLEFMPENPDSPILCELKKKSVSGNSEEKGNIRGLTQSKKQAFKFTAFQIEKEAFLRESTALTDKFSGKVEEETWSHSKFTESAIFKDEASRLKCELFQKQAQLFQKNQRIQELEEQLKNSETSAYRKDEEIARLHDAMSRMTRSYSEQEEGSSTSKKWLSLKLRQHQLEARERDSLLAQVKDKEKKSSEQYERIIAAMKEVVRQREEQVERNRKNAEEKLKKQSEELSRNEWIIRELSEQIAHLRGNVKDMEQRMRQMIEREQELNQKVAISQAQPKESSVNAITQGQMSELRLCLSQAKSDASDWKSKCAQLSQKYQIMEKDYKGIRVGCFTDRQVEQCKILQKRVTEVTLKLTERERLLDRYRNQEKQRGNSRGNHSHSREREGDIGRLRATNCKLMKQVDKLNLLANTLSCQLHQCHKVNLGLNEELLRGEAERMEKRLHSRWSHEQQ